MVQSTVEDSDPIYTVSPMLDPSVFLLLAFCALMHCLSCQVEQIGVLYSYCLRDPPCMILAVYAHRGRF
jgi:hypothetical protein